MVDQPYRLKVAAFIVLLAVLAPLSALAGPATQPLIKKKLPVLADCALIPDQRTGSHPGPLRHVLFRPGRHRQSHRHGASFYHDS